MQKQKNSQFIDEVTQAIEERVNYKQDKPLIIAIEGRSAAGKTTLANELADRFEGSVVHMDDFFLPIEMRTPERFAIIGGNIHQERFQEEIINPLAEARLTSYRRFSCDRKQYEEIPIIVDSKNLVIVEGAYSMLPVFGEYYDMSIFLDIPYEMQKSRIEKRNGLEKCQQFIERWIPFEERYINTYHIQEKCSYYIQAQQLQKSTVDRKDLSVLTYN